MFRVGQKVVCVDANPSWRGVSVCLVKSAIYTVLEITKQDINDDLGVRLLEASSIEDKNHYSAFRASRFRPVVKRKTDISVFQRMLNHAPAEAERAGGEL